MHVHFAEPRWLWAGGIACLALAALLLRAGRARARAVALLGGQRAVTSVSPGRRRLKQALTLIGTAALFVALARPQAGFRWEETRRQGIDLMFAVDTSKSMLATDLRPDRLARAKLAVRDLVRELPGERFGLIAFAGDAFVQAPMTTDQAVFEEALDALDTSIIPRGGTDVASAIRAAESAMASEPDRRKVLILLSDGEDLAGDARAAAAEAAKKGLTIETIGVGTAAGELIAARDEAGQPVRSRLDEETLAAVARATGGAYVPLGPSGRGLETLYRTTLAQLPRSTTAERWRRVYTERFQIPLAVAIACLLVELAIGERRRRPRAAAAVAAAVLVLAAAGAARAEAPGDVGAYNAGTGAYRQRDFGAAQQRFQAATRAGDLGVQADAYYDLGNTRFRLGQATEKEDPAATIEAWKGALSAYDGALALNHGDADARFNRDFVARKLADLERQQQQQDKQQQDKQQQQGKQQQNQKQPGKPQQSPQQQAGQGQQPKANQPGQSKPANAGSGQGQPQQQAGAGQPRSGQERQQRGEDGPSQAGERGGDQRKQPGALSRGEADQLLDSLDGQMQRLPMAGFGKRPPTDEQPAKDW
jgi:Ca-activated chloride channel homolog